VRLAVALAVTALVATVHVEAATSKFAACPRRSEATRLPVRPGSHVLRGDVDGDGSADLVSMHYSKWAKASCAFLLAVETNHGTRAAAVPAYDKGITVSGWQHVHDYSDPSVGSLVRIRPHGLVVTVAVSRGASTVQTRLYWFARGRLVSPHRELTAYGDIAHNNQVSCYHGGRTGLIVETGEATANDAGTRWAFGRTISRLTDRGLERVQTSSLAVGSKKARALERRWRLGYPPFRGCTVAGGL
jgi:hypothetical protein